MSIHRNIRLLAWFNFFEDFRPYAPVAALYFARITGSFTLAMTVLSLSMVSRSVFEVPTGLLSDAVGRRSTMLLGSVAGVINVLFWALGGSFWVLALGSVFAGLASAFFSGNNQALLHDSLREEGKEDDYSHFLGRTSAFFQVGLGTSAIVGGVLAARALRYAMWAGIIPQLACILLAFLMVEPRVRDKDSQTNVLHHLHGAFRCFRDNRRLRTLSIASMLDFGIGQAQFEFTPVFFALFWPVWALGLARSLAHSLGFISFLFAGRVIKRFEPLKALMTGKGVSHVLAFIAYGLRSVFSPLILVMGSLFFGVKLVAENTLLQREFSDEQRATMGSLTQLGGSIVYALAAVAFGAVADRFGVTHALIASELMLVVVLLLYRNAFRHSNS